ncbi:hypothetical protein [Pseudochryseolinea flava]|uniref:Uncharacterized protein n=1 Tax=Pseudochryseolinea flava TaxID=2059302 RepID=A0A364XWX8_9BACT|nr:hypothetical protein [Pseudochryseolinea flava]RAV98780.1 hypothetical protein DQQ10_22445 [Pseudochryseolinea flava]
MMRLTKIKGLFLLPFLLVFSESFCQEIKVTGGFFEDSIKVGEPARFYLAARYPSKINILFPDSTFDFASLEFRSKEYFDTETKNDISYDSVVYHLASFSIDPIQTLSLPIFQINPNDCTLHVSNIDSIKLTLTTPNVDTVSIARLDLKHQATYQPTDKLFNYPLLIFVVGITLVLVALGWFFFGKPVRKHFKIKRMMKAHQAFLVGFDSNISGLQKQYSPLSTEATLVYWKRYLEQLERLPYTKLTSREIQRIQKDDQLGKTLHGIDEAIYGHNTQTTVLFESLKTFAQNRFNKKLEEVKHG